MNRDELHSKLDKLFDSMETLKDKAEDAIENLKDKAEDAYENRDEILEDAKMTASVAADSVARAACRGKNWLKDNLINAQMEIDGVQDKFEAAKADMDKAAALKYTESMEKYAEDMLNIAQEAADEAADAVLDAVNARKDYTEKFGE